MKINLPVVTNNLVTFGSLKAGDAFFTGVTGDFGIKGHPIGDVNATVYFPDGSASMYEFGPAEMVEPCDAEIIVTRRDLRESSDLDLTFAEKELAKLPDGRLAAMMSYKQRVGASLAEAKEKVEAFLTIHPLER